MSNQKDLAVTINATVNGIFTSSPRDQEVIDFIQAKLGCCGASGPQFWNNAYPKSCYEDENKKNVYENGCQNASYDFLLNIIRIIGTVILALAPLEVST